MTPMVDTLYHHPGSIRWWKQYRIILGIKDNMVWIAFWILNKNSGKLDHHIDFVPNWSMEDFFNSDEPVEAM
jgi:hypothetical protein